MLLYGFGGRFDMFQQSGLKGNKSTKNYTVHFVGIKPFSHDSKYH